MLFGRSKFWLNFLALQQILFKQLKVHLLCFICCHFGGERTSQIIFSLHSLAKTDLVLVHLSTDGYSVPAGYLNTERWAHDGCWSTVDSTATGPHLPSPSVVNSRLTTVMTRRASHPQYTMGILRSWIVDKGPGIQVG